ncbi:3293_t:CDS:2 [Acaulospora morrowiae]|uniref:3293_t:CDS:1 n=1 Tax=Acaulospora morrowiae TaxID=94023 RepID=A0A9N9H5U5_9GLOM|nr:3293_t:CDS:2 [Acaulospora morrowiae]
MQAVDINDLTYDDPLANGIIDLGSSQYQLMEDDYAVLVGEKGGIRNLEKETRRHKDLIEGKTSSENALVDIITHLVEMLIYQMPVDFDKNGMNSHMSKVGSGNRQKQKPLIVITS